VILLASSGTGAMEAAVSNLASPGDEVLVLTAGKFGERWQELAKAYGLRAKIASAPYGDTFSPDVVRAMVTEKIKCIYMQSTESSTGVRHDVEAVARTRNDVAPGALLIVDAITGLGTTQFDVDGWGVDVIIGGSQKAVMIPPGLAYCAVSERAWKRMEQVNSPRYYFDLHKERKSAAKGESSFTPATSLVAALAAAMDYIRSAGNGDLAHGRDALIQNAELAAAMTRAAAHALGLKLFAKNSPAAALTAIEPPAGCDSGAIVKGFRQHFGAVVADGQGEMKGKLFRIAHLGYYDYLDTIGIIGALEHVIAHAAKPAHAEFGSGLRAAQLVYAREAKSAAGVAGG
jgi:aspartate aminotransferase-like enzyme